MGHIRLGTLPQTKRWRQVVSLLEGGAGTPEVASATLEASKSGFQKAAKDEGLLHTAWLLTQVVSAARSPNFSSSLNNAGLDVEKNPGLLDIVGAFTDAVDSRYRETGGRTDVGEMAQMAAAETITSLIGRETQTLFGTSPADVQDAFKKFSTTKQFGTLAREFFSRFTQRYLSYFLSRELAKHIGGEHRFANIKEHQDFVKALNTHCVQASEIVENFSGGWFSKTKFLEGEITPEKTAGYVHVALKKLASELEKRGEK